MFCLQRFAAALEKLNELEKQLPSVAADEPTWVRLTQIAGEMLVLIKKGVKVSI